MIFFNILNKKKMIKKLVISLLFSLILTYDTLSECESESVPVSIEKCNEHNGDQTNIKCCYISFKSAGKYYSLCKQIINTGADIKSFKSKIKKQGYSKVNIQCSSNYISYTIFFILFLLF